MAKKEKKISVKHYLNKKLKPGIHKGKNYYPVYLRLGYDRITTIVKSNYLVYSDDIFSKDVVENEKDHLYKIEYLTEEDFLKPEIQSLFNQEYEAIKLAMNKVIELGYNPVKSFEPIFFSFISEPLHIAFGAYLSKLISEEIKHIDALLFYSIDYGSISISELDIFIRQYLSQDIKLKILSPELKISLLINIGIKIENRKDLKVFHILTDELYNINLTKTEINYLGDLIVEVLYRHRRE